MVVAMVEHALNLEDVSSSREGAHVNENESLLSNWGLDRLERFDSCVGSVLST